MNICALCGKPVEAGRDMSRRQTCRNCGGDLHICLNCRFYSETAHNRCIETRAEHQRDRDRANFCDYFQFRDSDGPASGDSDAKQEALRKLDDLFK